MMNTWNAQDYHQHSSQQQIWARDALAMLALEGGEHVLDIGCGDGKVTAQIARAVPRGRVVGLDTSPDMIQFAQRNFPADRHPNLHFQKGDARALTFVGEFDAVVSFACLHWVIDHQPVLAGIARALRSGGRVLLQFGGRGNAADIMDAVTAITERAMWRDFFVETVSPWGFYGPEEYRPWLAAAGLRERRVELIPKDMVHAGADELAGWLRTTWMPYVQRVPPELRERFIEAVLREYLRGHPPDAGGRVHLKMVRLEVEAARP
jgi:trans-aconitate 2-methyltransferase